MSSSLEPIFLDRAQITTKATCPPEESIQVNSSSASFCKTVQTLFSHEPHAAPCGKKLESQKVIIASARSNIDCPANPVKQKFSTFACWLLSALSKRLSANLIPPLPETSCTSKNKIRATS